MGMIETIEGDHSFNMDELLTYLLKAKNSQHDLSVANMELKPAQSKRHSAMELHYRRMYEAALHYRREKH